MRDRNSSINSKPLFSSILRGMGMSKNFGPGKSARVAECLQKAIVESLERRTFLTTVTSLADTYIDRLPMPGTLRSAIQLAEATGGDHTINFDISPRVNGPQIITLAAGALELDDTSSGGLTIQGPSGPNSVTIEVPSTLDSSVFQVDSGSTASISSLSISGGFASTGGGVNNLGSLTISNCTINGNLASTDGGGIYDAGPALSVTDTTVSSNLAGAATGTITDPNPSIGDGGGIFIAENAGAVSIVDSTLSGNCAYSQGGGIDNNADLAVSDCTITGNAGSGIANTSYLSLSQSTDSENTSGSGVDDIGTPATAVLTSSIVSGNISGPDLNGNGFSGTYSLIGDSSGGAVFGYGNSYYNRYDTNPQLGSLGNYGGPTLTMPLLPGSLAIRHGEDPGPVLETGGLLTSDQRGFAIDPGGADIGAFQTDYTSLITSELPDLPSYSEPASDPSLPSGAEAFAPPVAVGSQPIQGAPVIAASNLDGQPDDTLTLTGGPFISATGVPNTDFLVYGQTTDDDATALEANVQESGPNAVLATIPDSEAADSMYFVWAENAHGVSAPIAVNRTDAQWMQINSSSGITYAYHGDTVSVYGRNMDNGSGKSWIYLQPVNGSQGQWVDPNGIGFTNGNPDTAGLSQSPDATPYQVQFNIPDELAAGNYQVWVHNGLGGLYGWSMVPTALDVSAPVNWNSAHEVTVEGNGYNAIQSAINTLNSNYPGDMDKILYFPSGTYNVYTSNTQLLYLNTIASGAFELNYNGEVTDAMPFSTTALEIQSELNSIVTASGSTDSVTVTPGGANAAQFTIQFASGTNSVPISIQGDVEQGQGFVQQTDQILLPSGTEVLGQGLNSSVINFDGGFPNQGYGAFDIGTIDTQGSFVDFESIGLNYAGPTVTPTGGYVVRERYAYHMTFHNVDIHALGRNIYSIDWEGSAGLALTNSVIYTSNTYINLCDYVFLEADTFWQAYGQGLPAVSVLASQFVTFTHCITENYYDIDPALGRDGFGEGKFVEFATGSSNIYCADNQTINMGEWGGAGHPADANSGEQILIDNAPWLIDETVSSPDRNSVTVANQSDFSGINWATAGYYLDITSGADMGQRLEIIAGSDNGNGTTTLTVTTNFAVTPNTGDYVSINQDPTNIVVYRNSLNYTTGQYRAAEQSCEGIGLGSAYDAVIDGNVINNTLYGIRDWSSNDGGPLAYADVINNLISVVQTGYNNGATPPTGITINFDPPPPNGAIRLDPNYYGVAVRGNTVSINNSTGTTSSVGIDLRDVFLDPYHTVTATLSVIEHNYFSGFLTGAYISYDPTSFIYKNLFDLGTAPSAGAVAIAYNASPSDIMIVENSYNAYPSRFGGNDVPTNSALGSPQYLLFVTTNYGQEAVLPLVLVNEGPDDFQITGFTSAGANGHDLTFVSIGTTIISGQHVTFELEIDPEGRFDPLNAGFYAFDCTVTASDGSSVILTIYLTVSMPW